MAEVGRAQLPSLTGLRAIAAGIVLMYHWTRVTTPDGAVAATLGLGFTGVTFFFVLSGFVLTWAYADTGAERSSGPIRDLYLRRFARIWPLHITLVMVALVVGPMIGQIKSPLPTLLSVPLLQAWLPTQLIGHGGNGVSWSLSVEVFLYACFPLLLPRVLRARRWLRAGLVIWCVSAVLVSVVLVTLARIPPEVASPAAINGAHEYLLYYLPASRLGEFVVGMLLASAIRSGWRLPVAPSPALVGAAAATAGVLGGLMVLAGGVTSLPYGLVDLIVLPLVVVIVAAAATTDLQGWRAPLSGIWWQRFGHWSFALFLGHQLVIESVVFVAGFGMAQVLLGTLVAVALAALLHHGIERPAHTAILRRVCREPGPVPSRARYVPSDASASGLRGA